MRSTTLITSRGSSFICILNRRFENVQQLIFWIVIIIFFLISIISVSYFEFISMNDRRTLKEPKLLNESVLSYLITDVIPLTNMDINSVNSLLVNALLYLIIGKYT